MNELKRKYGLFTAICMVVGIVIGSGVFFKAEAIHKSTGGNLPVGILAWLMGGLIMIACVCMFSIMATKYEKVNGVVDYAEATVGGKYAYYVGWFLTTTYYPTIASVLVWLSARYTLVLFGFDDPTTGTCLALSCFFLVASYAINALSPVVAGKIQVSTTIIKLIPLLLMAIVGTVVGLSNGMAIKNFTSVVDSSINPVMAFFTAVVATSFAYEGWIIATSINAELKDAKKNLPIALIAGSIIIVLVYILYYIGLSGTVSTADLIEKGVNFAFNTTFGSVAGTILVAFIAVSCMGALNGLMLGCTRGMHSIAIRNQGPKPEVFKTVDPNTNMATNSSVLGAFFTGLWLFYFYGANLASPSLFGYFSFDSSELPIVTVYALYIPIFIMFMVKAKGETVFKRIIMPITAIIASLCMIVAALYAHGISPYMKAAAEGRFSLPVLFYLIIFAIDILIGAFFYKKNRD